MKKRIPVIDTHFHLGVNPLAHSTVEDLFSWMDSGKIDIQVIMQVNEGMVHRTPRWNPYIGNDWIAEVQKMYPDRVIGLGGVDPWLQPPSRYMFPGENEGKPFDRVTSNPCLEELDRVVLDLGLWGLKIHPLEHNHQVNNPKIMNPIYERLTELQRACGRRLILFIHAAGDSVNNTPEAMADAAGQFPELLFIASHAGFKWCTPTVAHTMAALDNVMLDLTTMAYGQSMREVYLKYGASKFCAGSDGPFASVQVKDAIVRSITGDEEEQRMILGGNLAKYLGIGL